MLDSPHLRLIADNTAPARGLRRRYDAMAAKIVAFANRSDQTLGDLIEHIEQVHAHADGMLWVYRTGAVPDKLPDDEATVREGRSDAR